MIKSYKKKKANCLFLVASHRYKNGTLLPRRSDLTQHPLPASSNSLRPAMENSRNSFH